MAKMISTGGYLLRIAPNDDTRIERSDDDAKSWYRWYNTSGAQKFEDLTDHGSKLLATTNEGLFCSTDGGKSWYRNR